MGRLFEIVDTTENLPDGFEISDSSPSNYRVSRLIMGGVSVTNIMTGNEIQLNTNYLGFSYEFDENINDIENLAKIFGESINVDDLRNYFFDVRFKSKNTIFFRRLENEFCNFLYYQSKGNYTTAFIFLYRILEVVSYSFPLIYSSRSYDFKGTYGALKLMFEENSGKQKGELGFFKSAINVMFKDREDGLLGTSIDFELNEEFEINEKIFSAVNNICSDKIFHTSTVENSTIAIVFGEMGSFIITIRNRFFHLFNRGDRNLESVDFVDPDLFFSIINEPTFKWLSMVFLEVNRFLFEEYLRYLPGETHDSVTIQSAQEVSDSDSEEV